MPKDISIRRLRHYWPLYALVLPSALLVAVFAYYPALSAIYHAFYRWNGDDINYFIGLANFRRALGAPVYWGVATILTALTVIFGARRTPVGAALLLASGVAAPLLTIAALVRLGHARAGGPTLWCAAFAIAALATWIVPALRRRRRVTGLRLGLALGALSAVFWALAAHSGGDATLWAGFYVTLILIVTNVLKMLPSILTAVVIHRLRSDAANYWYRVLFVIPMIIPGMVYLLIWKFFFEPERIFNLVLAKTGLLALLVHMDAWFGWGGVFQDGINPVWLGSPQLVLPAMVLWGFPWVGVVGVLIYLAGLQSIDTAVYEAADLDGASAVGKFFHIELPLILTQVRINLVLMIIGTLQSYGFVLILFGESGGPNGRLMIPGLYMFRQAFIERYVGYACCIGLILFVFILILTEINNRYLRVEK